MARHSTLTGADLHEPKGVASATAGQVYVADGAGSGDWVQPAASNVTLTDTEDHYTATTVEDALEEIYEREVYLTGSLADISTAGFVLVPIPDDGTVSSITFSLGAAITAADATLTVTRGGDSASLGTQVVTYTGSAEGDTYSFTPSGNAALVSATHRYLKIATNGNSTTTAPIYFTISFVRD